ncbi:LacI family DNA-binding transcriptional regulator [Kineococcus rhizosphaerae]|uniref:LacI family transcriptional regulator n=1 Tax=Kineococcus rhizosphaerae TaxID=559628 RepID=A0A2T0R3H0_9ACTN|nr:LacI family DNA-binding transcriptional regulator [Kineococcus rhizosphaerae]PRY14607.1 LacI family transcriptional regulator [Kineococcus rhizosphaerae]
MAQKRATIYEVATLAGVSHQTVSRYLRHNGGLKPATTAKVEAAIAELNYRPNLVARSMRTRRSGRLAFLVPAVKLNVLPLRLVSEAVTVGHAAGYAIDLTGLEGSAAERAERVRELAECGEYEGVLSLGTHAPGPEVSPSATPVVTIANYDDELRGTGALADSAAGVQIVRTLAELGHEHFLHVSGPPGWASARNRLETFLKTTADLGVRGTVAEGDWHGQSGFDAVAALPRDTPVTAVVAANDHVAVGAMRALTQRGWRVPRDVSVFGWDGHDFGRFCTPTLSTVVIDVERQGREAMERLVALARGLEPPAPDARSLHTFLPRESIGPAPTRRARLKPLPAPR